MVFLSLLEVSRNSRKVMCDDIQVGNYPRTVLKGSDNWKALPSSCFKYILFAIMVASCLPYYPDPVISSPLPYQTYDSD